MKEDYSHITVLLDRSGSMGIIKNDVIGGFNEFVDKQSKEEGEATITLIDFDSVDRHNVIVDMVPLSEAPKLTEKTYLPRGGTPLYDAIYQAVVSTGDKLAAMKEEDRPETVIFCIMTDGEENSSLEVTQEAVFAMIKKQEDEFDWDFVYVGANQDAMSISRGIGVSSIRKGQATSMSFDATAEGTQGAYMHTNSATAEFRSLKRKKRQDTKTE